jgi:hypothetical protein
MAYLAVRPNDARIEIIELMGVGAANPFHETVYHGQIVRMHELPKVLLNRHGVAFFPFGGGADKIVESVIERKDSSTRARADTSCCQRWNWVRSVP